MENNDFFEQQAQQQHGEPQPEAEVTQPVCDALPSPEAPVADVIDNEIPVAEQPVAESEEQTPVVENREETPGAIEEPAEPTAVPLPINELETRIAALDAKFDEKILRDRRQSEMFDKLYKELETYRKDVYAKMLKPLIIGLVMLLDDLERAVERIEGADDAGERAIKKLRDEVPEDLRDLLEENGVELYNTEGDIFDPRSQKSMSVEPTADPDLDKHIARRLRHGYRWNGTTLRPETVVIYKYDPNLATPAEPTPADPAPVV